VASRIEAGELKEREPVRRDGTQGLLPATDRSRIQRLAHDGVGPVRERDGLDAAWEELRGIRRPGRFVAANVTVTPQTAEWETTNVAQTAAGIIAAARVREESRGGHFRRDFPAVNDKAWKQRLAVTFDEDNHIRVNPIGLDFPEA
jgi:L-aspartate oxidase